MTSAKSYEEVLVSYGTDQLHVVKKHDSMSNEPSSMDLPPRAWRKFYEKLRPSEAKKRRAREFDAIMKREIFNPIDYNPDEAAWRREMAAAEREEKEKAAWSREISPLDGDEKEEFSLQDALDYVQPQEEEDDKEEDKKEDEEDIPIPTFLVKKKVSAKVLPASELRLFRTGMM